VDVLVNVLHIVRLNCCTNGGAATLNAFRIQVYLNSVVGTAKDEDNGSYEVSYVTHFRGRKMNSKNIKNNTSHKIPNGNYIRNVRVIDATIKYTFLYACV